MPNKGYLIALKIIRISDLLILLWIASAERIKTLLRSLAALPVIAPDGNLTKINSVLLRTKQS